MTAVVLRGDARRLPLPDGCVDLIVTSPPYFGLRSYTDDGAHYDGQIGSEATPAEWVAALVGCTAEWVRVLKPSGSIFVNLGDSHASQPAGKAGRNSQVNGNNPAQAHAARRGERNRRPTARRELTREDAAWLAGVIDSDGSISIRATRQQGSNAPSFVAWVRIGQKRPEVIKRAAEITGIGQVMKDGRGVWNWCAAAQQARWILARIYPWLLIKQRQAAAAIEVARHVEERNSRGSYRPLTHDDIAYRQRLRDAVVAWNHGHEDDLRPPEPKPVALPRYPLAAAAKSLHGLPWQYALECVGQLGLILRRDIIWSKPNGLPESVTDRCRSSHEYLFHFTVQPRYYAAVDEIREPQDSLGERHGGNRSGYAKATPDIARHFNERALHPLGKLPGSVWEIREGESTVRLILQAVAGGALTIDEAERLMKGIQWTGSNGSTPGSNAPTAAGTGPASSTMRATAITAGPATATGQSTGSPTNSGSDPSPTDSLSTIAATPANARAAERDAFTADASTLPTSSLSPSGRTSGEDVRQPSPAASTGTTSHPRTPTSGPTDTGNAGPACEYEHGPTGDVWSIPSQPLVVPAHLGIDHFASFPMELPRRIILGWSPPGVCTACGEGRRPVTHVERIPLRPGDRPGVAGLNGDRAHGFDRRAGTHVLNQNTITGYACACPEPDAPVRPALVVDPFGGTGTTALVAAAYGRTGVSVDLSGDYCRLARWRTADPAERARALLVPKPPPVPDGQESLFGLDGIASA